MSRMPLYWASLSGDKQMLLLLAGSVVVSIFISLIIKTKEKPENLIILLLGVILVTVVVMTKTESWEANRNVFAIIKNSKDKKELMVKINKEAAITSERIRGIEEKTRRLKEKNKVLYDELEKLYLLKGKYTKHLSNKLLKEEQLVKYLEKQKEVYTKIDKIKEHTRENNKKTTNLKYQLALKNDELQSIKWVVDHVVKEDETESKTKYKQKYYSSQKDIQKNTQAQQGSTLNDLERTKEVFEEEKRKYEQQLRREIKSKQVLDNLIAGIEDVKRRLYQISEDIKKEKEGS